MKSPIYQQPKITNDAINNFHASKVVETKEKEVGEKIE
jgi:hypothetical protein